VTHVVVFLAVLECLGTGRKQVDAKKFTEAVATFEKCVEQAPDDEVIWSEYAAALVAAKQRGATVAKHAVGVAKTPAVKAASLYSLGQAMHDDPDPVMETEAYLESMRLRPNPTVAAALAKIDKTAQPTPSFSAAPMKGPFPTIEAACKAGETDTALAVGPRSRGRKPECACQPPTERAGEAPFDAWAKVVFECGDAGRVVALGVKVKGSWYTAPVAFGVPENQKRCNASADLGGTEQRGGVFAARTLWSTDCGGGGIDKDFRWTGVALVGVGASGKPSLIGPIMLSTDHKLPFPEGDAEVRLSRWRVEFKLSPAGELDVTGDPEWSKDVAAKVLGRHALSFP
jgi:hypothetical protein